MGSLSREEQARRWVIETCEACRCPGYAEDIRVQFSTRLRRCCGKAYINRGMIVLSTRYWDTAPEIRRDTVAHEVCHMIAYRLYGLVAPHGQEWQGLMRCAGFAPNVTVRCGVSHRIRREVICPSCGKVCRISSRRFNQAWRGASRLECPSCHEELLTINAPSQSKYQVVCACCTRFVAAEYVAPITRGEMFCESCKQNIKLQ